MRLRRHFKQTLSLKDRLEMFARQLRDQAKGMSKGSVRDELLKRASRAETAIDLDAWANSRGLRPPQ